MSAPAARSGGRARVAYALLPFALVAGSFAYMLWRAGGMGPILEALGVLPAAFWLLIPVFVFADQGTDGLRYIAVGRALGTEIPFGVSVRIAVFNLFVAFLTPGAGGAAPAVAWYLSNRGYDAARGFSIGLLKGLLGFYVLVPAAGVLVLVAPEASIGGVVRAVLGGSGIGLTLLLLGVLAVALWPKVSARLIGRIFGARRDAPAEAPGGPRLPKMRRLAVWLDSMLQGTAHDFGSFLRGRRRDVFGAIFITAFNLAILAAIAFAVGTGLCDTPPPPGELLTLSVLLVVLVFISPTPGGAGIAEGGGLIIFGGALGEARAAALVLIWRLVTSYIPFLLGALVFSVELRRSAVVEEVEAVEGDGAE